MLRHAEPEKNGEKLPRWVLFTLKRDRKDIAMNNNNRAGRRGTESRNGLFGLFVYHDRHTCETRKFHQSVLAGYYKMNSIQLSNLEIGGFHGTSVYRGGAFVAWVWGGIPFRSLAGALVRPVAGRYSSGVGRGKILPSSHLHGPCQRRHHVHPPPFQKIAVPFHP